jgi:hypothetical protein
MTDEELIIKLVDEAALLSDGALMILDRLLPEDMTFGTMPHATIQQLHLASTINYRAALACLRQAETSLAAYGLLRGLLEAWAHIDFIADDSQGGDARCRALRYERGAAQDLLDNLQAAPLGFDPSAWKTTHAENQQAIDDLWRDLGCANAKPRSRRHVEGTLKAISDRLMLDWVLPAWRSASAVVHMFGEDYIFDHDDKGNSHLVWALPRFRAAWLAFLAAAYGYLTVTSAQVLDLHDPEVLAFHEEVRSIAEHNEIRRLCAE